jgi:hypothetical protein
MGMSNILQVIRTTIGNDYNSDVSSIITNAAFLMRGSAFNSEVRIRFWFMNYRLGEVRVELSFMQEYSAMLNLVREKC